jgi:hypothetical protein
MKLFMPAFRVLKNTTVTTKVACLPSIALSFDQAGLAEQRRRIPSPPETRPCDLGLCQLLIGAIG